MEGSANRQQAEYLGLGRSDPSRIEPGAEQSEQNTQVGRVDGRRNERPWRWGLVRYAHE
jgi:hypothetical protein